MFSPPPLSQSDFTTEILYSTGSVKGIFEIKRNILFFYSLIHVCIVSIEILEGFLLRVVALNAVNQ
jgi:hypothetical protein